MKSTRAGQPFQHRLRTSVIQVVLQRLCVCTLFLPGSVLGKKEADVDMEESSCGLWLGPSPIKEQEEHGFGLGMFTGRTILKGSLTHPELFFPVYDFEDEAHPPLREYLWTAQEFKPLVLEVADNMLLFVPGLASIAPCTSNNFNLERVQEDTLTFDNHGGTIHRSKDASVGAFTYYQLPMFRAVRDILPGEELTVECPDDDFDASTHALNKFDVKDDKVVCLDDKLEERPSSIPNIGRGVFAKKLLKADAVVLISPALPLTRTLLDLDSKDSEGNPVGNQLLLNYCYGHPDSELLWLPYGPLMNSINHSKEPNVKVVWHQDPVHSNEDLSQRQQYHHPELLDFPVERVSDTHGKGLLMDVVAIRDIAPDEELVLDYGRPWADAWKTHEKGWKSYIGKFLDTAGYTPAMQFNPLEADKPIRTITEQHRRSYPPNILTACRFEEDWIEDEFAEQYDMIQYQSWDSQEEHNKCLLPCIILERIDDDDDDDKNGEIRTTYTAKLVDHHHENESIEYDCHIFRQFEYIYTDIPRHGIEFIEKSYSSDVFLLAAFRQPIQVSEGMYPKHWMRQKLRKRTTAAQGVSQEDKALEDSFKRKNIDIQKTAKEDLTRKQFTSPKDDL